MIFDKVVFHFALATFYLQSIYVFPVFYVEVMFLTLEIISELVPNIINTYPMIL